MSFIKAVSRFIGSVVSMAMVMAGAALLLMGAQKAWNWVK